MASKSAIRNEILQDLQVHYPDPRPQHDAELADLSPSISNISLSTLFCARLLRDGVSAP